MFSDVSPKTKHKFLLCAFFIFIVGSSAITIIPVSAFSQVYSEDFTTVAYKDNKNSNVEGWGSGSLNLPFVGPELISSMDFGATVEKIVIDGDLAYVACASDGLYIVNISDAKAPFQMAHIATGQALDVALRGQFAYVVGYDAIDVINITNPSSPAMLTSVNVTGLEKRIAVQGDFAFVAADTGGLQILNLTDPTNPVSISECALTGPAVDVNVRGNTAFVAAQSGGLDIVNITFIRQPILSSSLPLDGSASRIYLDGSLVSVGCRSGGLSIVAVDDIDNPVIVSNYTTIGESWGTSLSGRFAFVTDTLSGIHIVNMTNPAQPITIGTFNEGIASPTDCVVEGEYAYIADGIDGFKIVQLGDIVAPVDTSSVPIVGALDVLISGNLAYVGATDNNFYVVNITDIGNPSVIGSCSTGAWIRRIAVSGNYAYLANGRRGLAVINVTNPQNPIFVRDYPTSGESWSISISGHIAYVTTTFASEGLMSYNITIPGSEYLLQVCNIGNIALSVNVQGDYAFIGSGSSSLLTVNVTDPANMSVVGSVPTNAVPYGIAIQDTHAYLACLSGGLQVFDIINPLQPSVLASLPTPGYAYDLVTVGNSLYVAMHSSGWERVNISVPSQPQVIDGHNTTHLALHIRSAGEYVFISDYDGGLRIYQVLKYRVWDSYQESGTAESSTVFSANGNSVITRATLSFVGTISENTSIQFYLSSTNGSTWEPVTPDATHVFTSHGKELKWKALLSTSYPKISPYLDFLSISYETRLIAPAPQSPIEDYLTNSQNIAFNWTAIDGAIGYYLQLDTSQFFNTTNMRSVGMVLGTSAIVSGLSEGNWYWRVGAVDVGDDLGNYSATYHLTIDITPPEWVEPIGEQWVEFGLPFHYDVNASDSSGISHYAIYGGAMFSIDNNGVITNNTALAVGSYPFTIEVSDNAGNILEDTLAVNVVDTVAPAWIDFPVNQVIEFPELYTCQLSAWDKSGIGYFSLNDTVHFTVNSTGFVQSIGSLDVGIYHISAKAYDSHGLSSPFANFTVTVVDTTAPTWADQTMNITIFDDETFGFYLSAYDASGVVRWSVTHPETFIISDTGYLTSPTGRLDAGVYDATVTAYDPYDNNVSATIQITVLQRQPSGLQIPIEVIVITSVGLATIVLVVLYFVRHRKNAS